MYSVALPEILALDRMRQIAVPYVVPSQVITGAAPIEPGRYLLAYAAFNDDDPRLLDRLILRLRQTALEVGIVYLRDDLWDA